jgi:hypothetical protein
LVVWVVFGFIDVVVKWENVLFFAFHAVRFGVGFFGVMWKNVIAARNLALRGLALWGFFDCCLFYFILFGCFWGFCCLDLFAFCTNFLIGLLVFPVRLFAHGVGLSLNSYWIISVAPMRGGTYFLCRRKER